MSTNLKMRIKWSKKEKDYIVFFKHKADGGTFLELIKPKKFLVYSGHDYYQKDPRFKCENSIKDDNFLNGVTWKLYAHDIIKDLESRGYDPKTLKLEISIDPTQLKEKFQQIYNNLTTEEKKKLDID